MTRVKLMIIREEDRTYDVPEGWFVLTAVPLRTTGVAQATIGLILQELRVAKRIPPRAPADDIETRGDVL